MGKKIVKLTESDLRRIVERVIKEGVEEDELDSFIENEDVIKLLRDLGFDSLPDTVELHDAIFGENDETEEDVDLSEYGLTWDEVRSEVNDAVRKKHGIS